MSSRMLWASTAASHLRISVFRRGFASVIEHLKYADSHEWADVDGTFAKIGITDHAQDHLGDVVYVELPDVGSIVSKGKNFGSVESVKATSEVYSPISGEVIEVNTKLNEAPGLINASPYKEGWIMKVQISDSSELKSLMDSDQYKKLCEEEDAKH